MVTANEQAKSLQAEQEVLQGKPCEIILNGKAFEVAEKTPRQARPLMALGMTITPILLKCRQAVVDAGYDPTKAITPEVMASIPIELQVQSVEAVEQACKLIEAATDRDPDVVAALEYATDKEVFTAFRQIKEMLENPILRRLKKSPTGSKPSTETPPSNTNETPPPETSTCSPDATN